MQSIPYFQRVAVLLVCSLLMAKAAWAESYNIQHVEPLHWWVGMNNPQLQLMVHGPRISELEPVIDYPGVSIRGVKKTDNKNFIFVDLYIAPETRAGSFVIGFKHGETLVVKANYHLESRRSGSAQRRGFGPQDAIYLLVPDRFANGNPSNDTVKGLAEGVNRQFSGGRHGGDLKGMSQHLDYVAAMGFTQIWPTPLLENDQEKYSYHGYSQTNHYLVDKRIGSNEEYRKFVAAARKKGIGVIQDMVLNHIGSGHWWMKDLPAADWLNFPNEYVETTHRRTAIHDIHAAPEDAKKFTDGWFVRTMPDMNQRNPLLATYLIQNSIWWIEYADLSGIREDTYSYSDKEFLKQWGKAILDEYPNFNMVGEEWTSNPAIVALWQKGKHNDNGYVSYMPSMMDFPVHEAMRKGLVEEEAWGKGFIAIYEAIANDFIYADPMHMVVFPDNHDTSRIYSALDDQLDLFKNAMALSATTRGIPQYFYGSEILFTSPKERDDGAVRADMLGGWAGDKVNAFTGKGLTAKQLEAQDYVKKLLNWRKTNSAISSGKLLHYVPEQSTYVYFRYSDNQRVMVVLNKNKQDIVLDLARYAGGLQGKVKGRDVIDGSSVDLTKPVPLKAMTPLIIEL